MQRANNDCEKIENELAGLVVESEKAAGYMEDALGQVGAIKASISGWCGDVGIFTENIVKAELDNGREVSKLVDDLNKKYQIDDDENSNKRGRDGSDLHKALEGLKDIIDKKPPESKQEPPDLTKVRTTDQFFGLVKDGNGEYGIRATAFSRAELSQKTNRYKMIENLLAEKYKLSAEEVELLMKYFEKKGIPNTYVAFMNGVTSIYRNEPDLFEKQFGQPLYGIQNDKLILNDTGMVLDAFVGLNSGDSENDLFINKDGKMTLNKQLLENEKFVPKSHINKDGSLNKELVNKYLNSKTKGLSIKESTIDISKSDNNTIKKNIQNQLDANKAVEIFDGRNTFVVTGTTEEGIYVSDENATRSFISFDAMKGKGTSGGNANVSTTKKIIN